MSGAIDYARIDAAAARQYGLVTLAQLDRAGVTPQTRRRLLTGQLLVRARPRVYRLCGAPPSWQSSALAVVLNVGSPCVVSHGSAGVLWGLLDQRETCGPGRPARIQITCTSYCRLPGVESHRHTLAGSEVTVRLRIPVTTIERTIVDLATTARTKQVGEYMDDALRRQLTTPARLSAAGASLTSHGRRRVKPFLEALRDRGIGYDPGANPWEQSMDRLWDELGLPPAVRQYRVGWDAVRSSSIGRSSRRRSRWSGTATLPMASGASSTRTVTAGPYSSRPGGSRSTSPRGRRPT